MLYVGLDTAKLLSLSVVRWLLLHINPFRTGKPEAKRTHELCSLSHHSPFSLPFSLVSVSMYAGTFSLTLESLTPTLVCILAHPSTSPLAHTLKLARFNPSATRTPTFVCAPIYLYCFVFTLVCAMFTASVIVLKSLPGRPLNKNFPPTPFFIRELSSGVLFALLLSHPSLSSYFLLAPYRSFLCCNTFFGKERERASTGETHHLTRNSSLAIHSILTQRDPKKRNFRYIFYTLRILLSVHGLEITLQVILFFFFQGLMRIWRILYSRNYDNKIFAPKFLRWHIFYPKFRIAQ